MTTNTGLTDAALEAVLARYAGRVSADGLRAEIMTNVAATGQARRPAIALPAWLTWPAAPGRLTAIATIAWVLLLTGLVLGLVIGGLAGGLWQPSEPSPSIGQVRGVVVYSLGVEGAYGPGTLYAADPFDPGRTSLCDDSQPKRGCLLTPDGGPGELSPEWSPDGRKIAFLRYTTGGPNEHEIVVLDVDTRAELGVGVFWCRADLEWSPDSRRIAYSVPACETTTPVSHSPNNPRTDSGLFVYDLQTGVEARRLEGGELTVQDWSQDGGHILVLDGVERRQLIDVDVDDRSAAPRTIAMEAWAARYSPDGQSLAVSTTTDSRLLTTGADELRRLGGSALAFDWSPDGTRLVKLYGAAIVVTSVTGSGENVVGSARSMPRGERLRTPPSWTSDGSRIYWSDADGTWTVRPDGTDLTKLPLPASIEMDWTGAR